MNSRERIYNKLKAERDARIADEKEMEELRNELNQQEIEKNIRVREQQDREKRARFK